MAEELEQKQAQISELESQLRHAVQSSGDQDYLQQAIAQKSSEILQKDQEIRSLNTQVSEKQSQMDNMEVMFAKVASDIQAEKD